MSGPTYADVAARLFELQTTLAKAERERDAALAKAEGYRRDQKEATETALRNMAKAETAEKREKAMGDNLVARNNQLADLRARIEALADEWDGNSYVGQQLRALLQPPKEETPRNRLIASLLRNGAITEHQRDLLLETTP